MKIKTSFRLRKIFTNHVSANNLYPGYNKATSRFNKKTTQLKNGQKI